MKRRLAPTTSLLPQGGGWVHPRGGRRRESAWEDFQAADAPLPSAETWRRTDFSAWGLDRLRESDAPAAAFPWKEEAAKAARLGAELLSLEEAARKYPRLVEPRLIPSSAPELRKLECANRAAWRGGVFLRIPAGARIAEPLRLSLRHADAPFQFPRVLVAAEEGSDSSFFEEHLAPSPSSGPSRPAVSIAFSDILLGAGARLRCAYGQGLGADAVHFWRQRATLGPDSALEHVSMLLGGALHKSFLEVELAGPGARSSLYAASLAGGRRHVDAHTSQLHKAPRTSSDLLFRTALWGKARSVYTGLIRIEREAPDCEAYQAADNLLLSDEARADATPVLEILPDAVRCKHGATAGPVDQEELFYLATRGLSEPEAVRLLVRGFLDPALDRLPEGPAAREWRGRFEEASA